MNLKAKVTRVTITDLRDGTYYATLLLERGQEVLSVDARPSDSIAVALRTEAPLYVNEELLQVWQSTGTTIVFVAVLLGMLFAGKARPGQLASLAIAAIVAIPLIPFVLHGYQRRRLEIFLNPYSDPLGAGYNLLQARIAVGAGGFFGQGWLHGLQGQLGFVPERATDFVFAIFAEQFGLLGSLLLLAIFGALLIRLLKAAAVAPDRFGELIAAGVFVMVLVQVVENVGMNIGLLPIAGIPLPLISYGGSATITTLAALGLVQSVVLRRRRVVHQAPDPVMQWEPELERRVRIAPTW